jgi:hypothetical protein
VVARREASLDSLVGRFARVAARIESILVHDDCFEFSKNVKHAVDAGIVPKSLVGRLWDFRHLRNDVVHQPDSLTLVEMQRAREIAETLFTEIQALLEVHNNKKVAPSKMSTETLALVCLRELPFCQFPSSIYQPSKPLIKVDEDLS